MHSKAVDAFLTSTCMVIKNLSRANLINSCRWPKNILNRRLNTNTLLTYFKFFERLTMFKHRIIEIFFVHIVMRWVADRCSAAMIQSPKTNLFVMCRDKLDWQELKSLGVIRDIIIFLRLRICSIRWTRNEWTPGQRFCNIPKLWTSSQC